MGLRSLQPWDGIPQTYKRFEWSQSSRVRENTRRSVKSLAWTLFVEAWRLEWLDGSRYKNSTVSKRMLAELASWGSDGSLELCSWVWVESPKSGLECDGNSIQSDGGNEKSAVSTIRMGTCGTQIIPKISQKYNTKQLRDILSLGATLACSPWSRRKGFRREPC